MQENDTFKMTYSAQQQEEIQSIREKYLPKEASKLEQLRSLDARAGKKATAVSLAAGSVGAIVMGCGMSLIMTDFGRLLGAAAFPVGIVTGLAGMTLLALAYPLYNRILKQERAKIAPQILRLTDELMQ